MSKMAQPKLKDILSEELSSSSSVNQPKPKTIIHDNRLLYEVDLHRIMSAYTKNGFIIISAWRTAEADYGTKTPSQEQVLELKARNIENDKKLRSSIRTSGYGYVPTWGGYKEDIIDPATQKPMIDPKTGKQIDIDTKTPEPSYIVMAQEASNDTRPNDPNKLKELGKAWTKQFNQDCFLWKPPQNSDPSAYFITSNGDVSMTFSNPTNLNDLTEKYYTQLRKGSGRRFTLKEIKAKTDIVFYVQQAPGGMDMARRRYGELFFRFLSQ
jgi:hypothetical protein